MRVGGVTIDLVKILMMNFFISATVSVKIRV
jgi:hypothetical protein